MTASKTKILDAVKNLRRRLGKNAQLRLAIDEEQPLRAELFSSEQMQSHGKALAGLHRVVAGLAPNRLLARLEQNQGVLVGAFELLALAVKASRRISPAGEWLLDNFYLIEEQIRTARRHLPRDYSRELPRLQGGPSNGLPRVYDIALETVAHGDGHVDPESLGSFVDAYQSVTALRLGELWAIPIMLRLALIENLRRVGARIAADRAGRNLADAWADQMTKVAADDPTNLILVIADMARSGPLMSSSFVAEFARRLQGQSPALALPLTWIAQRLAGTGQTIEQLVQLENQQQAADQVSISNSIGSLRFVESMDWRTFVETMSTVDHKLREDPGGVYGRMDFATRDQYRHIVESLAKNGSLTEVEVARKAVQLAHQGVAAFGAEHQAAHVGYYLIGQGLAQLETGLGWHPSLPLLVWRQCKRFPLHCYLGVIGALSVAIVLVLLQPAHHFGTHGIGLALLAALVLLCASQLALSLVNWVAMLVARPHLLPRMDFSLQIPPAFRTLVVVPTMLGSARGVERLLEGLEVRFLANRDSSLHFGLLTDFRDADAETRPEDAVLVEQVQTGIMQLNLRYPGEHSDTFFLFHRPRQWNEQDAIWMGYERKRGKLGDLNALLRGTADRFALVVGVRAVLSEVRYVITLDTDTQLPRDAARQFVGAMAHPLNQPRFDAESKMVTAGYGILQPRVAASLSGANRSRYARLCGSEPGIDPYTRAVSDVYQDLFNEGSFIGKGIYDVEAFEQTLKGRFPENHILSHDLLEGCYLRSGLLSDVLLYEDDPATYQADVTRRYRWIRGDWQLLRWLWPGVPGLKRIRRANPLSALSRWKLFDNLRRSLVPAGLTALLLLGWTVLPHSWFWTLGVLGIMGLPALLAWLLELMRKPEDVRWRQHLADAGQSGLRRLAQTGFTAACLPFEACYSLDAVMRTSGRMLITRSRLLEWTASGDIDGRRGERLGACCQAMWIAMAIALGTAVFLIMVRPLALFAAAPFLLLWLLSPGIAWWISRPRRERMAHITLEQAHFLERQARRTWTFFETFVGPDDHWLPPDNFQEHAGVGVAHRTSPTNIGLALLANLTAHDFGYVSTGRLLERTAGTLATLAVLDRHQGHFYNWYDTQTLQPLQPAYISTVDSGNLAAHLLTLRAGLAGLEESSVVAPRLFDGLGDTLAIALESAGDLAPVALLEWQRELESAYDSRPATLFAARACLLRLAGPANQMMTGWPGAGLEDVSWWALALARQCRDALDDLEFLAPWLAHPGVDRGSALMLSLEQVRTLRQLADVPTPIDQGEPGALVMLGRERARARIETLHSLADQAGGFAAMEFDFLYDPARHLLAIGYNVVERRRDSGFYDLLASEARLCSFVAIAQGKLPQESWFALGRLLTEAGGDAILVSWSGSMFEYLMPLLVMPSYENTLLDATCKAAVRRQMAYGRQRTVPWGVSESGYNTVDVRLNYQYRAFGVPGLGLKRGLAEDLVVAPYATALALMVDAESACANLQRLAANGMVGRYGFYESMDYTPARVPRGQTFAVVRSVMAHHAGMSLLSFAHALLDRPMQRRFLSDPQFRATALVLQERIPRMTTFQPHTAEFEYSRAALTDEAARVRVVSNPDTPVPEVQLLSNGRYHVMVTHAGGGYSRWKDLAVTRWQEDTTCDNRGTFCYLRDVSSGAVWSNTHQPTLRRSPNAQAIFSEARAEFRRTDFGIETHTEIAVSPEDDVELRRLRLTNHGRNSRVIELTSYAEVVLAPAASDALHPAFSNLFIQTEIVRARQAILCTRRPRSQGEATPCMLHLMAVHGANIVQISYETDRARFIGRGNTVADPAAMRDGATLSDTEGSVLDPIVAIRYRITLEADQSATVNIVTGVADTRELALGLVEKYQDRRLADRVFELAWTHGQVILQQINATESDAQVYCRLAGSVIHANASMRAEPAVLRQNQRGQSGLWGYSISGDLPIVLLQITDAANIDLVRQVVRAHAYWRLKGLVTDLVIWNEDHTGYRQQLNEQIMGMIAAGIEANVIDRPGGIFVRPANHISNEDRVLLQSVARVVLSDGAGPLEEQVARVPVRMSQPAPFKASRHPVVMSRSAAQPAEDLQFFNGLGGFGASGREYVINTSHSQITPAPWVNVLANPTFGTVVSESGMAYTWSENAHEFRLSPWNNDPVSDGGGEAFYVRDEETGAVWSPTPLPVRGATPYSTRHGFGYSVFEHAEAGIASTMTVFVATDLPLKFTTIELHNDSDRPRRISVTGYVEWVLADLRSKSAMHLMTMQHHETGAVLAHNGYNSEFPERVAFFDVSEAVRSVTGDRTEFLGRNGSMADPAALRRQKLSGRLGMALDPCGAIQVPMELAAGERRELVFVLGAGTDMPAAVALLRRARGPTVAHLALQKVRAQWASVLGAVQVKTPDPMLDVMVNGWLPYQTLACRMWARSGYYQSGGAFGFRDQLQDSMALVHTAPLEVRAHLLRCAARQFNEGDVQHWWHPPAGRGVRTHCSDDFLWLPLAVCRYVQVTADATVLDEPVVFIEGRLIPEGSDSYYDLPGSSGQNGTLYEHCVRAIDHGLRFGGHGLPLIGSGDWNDGMNLVGEHGFGESVWLGFFLVHVLHAFGATATLRNDAVMAERCRSEAAQLTRNLEQGGWDGEWYLRAYFDDGTPLGTAGADECQIDSVPQSWAVLSGAGDPARTRKAMDAVDRRLVRRDAGLVQLLDPPFDRSQLNPGYIKGYVPGVRENGGQYTHAAIWTAMAFAELRDSPRAWELARMINPVSHAASSADVARYKVEPYVAAADVYAMAPHAGRGGWTWYTGSAGWMYRLMLESLLGLQRTGAQLRFKPCLPADWTAFAIDYRFKSTLYRIALSQAAGHVAGMRVQVDGVLQSGAVIEMVDDGVAHAVVIDCGVI